MRSLFSLVNVFVGDDDAGLRVSIFEFKFEDGACHFKPDNEETLHL